MTTLSEATQEMEQYHDHYEIIYRGGAVETVAAEDILDFLCIAEDIDVSGGWYHADHFCLRPCNPLVPDGEQLIIVDNTGNVRIRIDRTDYYIGCPIEMDDLTDLDLWVGELTPSPAAVLTSGDTVVGYVVGDEWVFARRHIDDFAGHSEKIVYNALKGAGARWPRW